MAHSVGYGRSRWVCRVWVDATHDTEDARADRLAWDDAAVDLEEDEDELDLLDDLRYSARFMARFD